MCTEKEGAQLEAWTVNSESAIQKCLDRGVDRLVTDDIELCRGLIDENNEAASMIMQVLGAFRR